MITLALDREDLDHRSKQYEVHRSRYEALGDQEKVRKIDENVDEADVCRPALRNVIVALRDEVVCAKDKGPGYEQRGKKIQLAGAGQRYESRNDQQEERELKKTLDLRRSFLELRQGTHGLIIVRLVPR